jgi:hypothetical protein
MQCHLDEKRPYSALHEVTGVRLDNQPNFTARFKLQGIACRERKVNIHFHAAIDARGNDRVSPLQRD